MQKCKTEIISTGKASNIRRPQAGAPRSQLRRLPCRGRCDRTPPPRAPREAAAMQCYRRSPSRCAAAT
eukprot:1799673-Pleurochrysis_carterae.AAC.1